MFELLFNYSPTAFRKGDFVFLGSWPVWAVVPVIALAGLAVGWAMWRRRKRLAAGMSATRAGLVWLLQVVMIALVVLLLWQPALQVSSLKPRQNIVAVVVDDSRSMAIEEGATTRLAQAVSTLDGGLLDRLSEQFQVRLYRLGAAPERIESTKQLTGAAASTRIGDGLSRLVAESASLPIGAVVLLSDGADNAAGISRDAITEIRSRRIPIHTIGYGRLRFERDLEVVDVQTPSRSLPDSRLLARVTFRHQGLAGQTARLTIRDAGRILASKDVTLANGVPHQTESISFDSGSAGAKAIEVGITPLAGEENLKNNHLSKLINVVDSRPRVLYFEGEPRWEYKFIRRAIEGDASIRLVSLLRTTQNKIYRQGISDPAELEAGFPGRVDDLFAYEGLIIGSVEVSSFTPAQQELIRQFADRRGGGVLFLGGRSTLAEGGYAASGLQALLPVSLPESKQTFERAKVKARLTPAGRESLVTRLVEGAEENAARWPELPALADYQNAGVPKPGAIVLAEVDSPAGQSLPLLITQNFGHGRAAVLATGGTWRWQMQQPLEDQTHELFWRQLLRWLVSGVPGHVSVSTPNQVVADDSTVELTAVVRDKAYAPAGDARVEARILGPAGSSSRIELQPDPSEAGVYHATWQAPVPGSYAAETVAFRGEEEVGRDVVTFSREDGVAEYFRAEQNRELLTKLSAGTGGQHFSPDAAAKLSEEISFSEAGVSVRETRPLWNMPILFLVILTIKALEWFLRRRWGVV